jgi:hypothetical protein
MERTVFEPPVKRLLVKLSEKMDVNQLSDLVDCHPRTITRLLDLHEKTGEVVRHNGDNGRPKILKYEHLKASSCTDSIDFL